MAFTREALDKASKSQKLLGRNSKGFFKPKSKTPKTTTQSGVLGKRIKKLPAMRTSLPSILRDLRIKANLSVAAVAKIAGLSKRRIEEYESGRAFNSTEGPGILRIERIIRSCGGQLVVEYDTQAERYATKNHGAWVAGNKSEPPGRDLKPLEKNTSPDRKRS
jgi:transcriptional regulator with XRE-family HTH domain